MASTNSSSPSKFQVEVQNMLNGLSNNLPATLKSMMVNGNSMTMVQVIAQFQSILDVLQAVPAAKTAYQHAVAARKAELVPDRAFYENVVALLKQTLGTTNQTTLSEFGIAAPKAKAKPSSTTKAIAQAKAAATRAARGTMGKKQKAAITTTPQPTFQVLGANGQPLGSTGAAPLAPSAAVPVAPAAQPASAQPAEAPVVPAQHP